MANYINKVFNGRIKRLVLNLRIKSKFISDFIEQVSESNIT